MEFYMSIRMNDLQLLATIWMNITCIILNQRSWSQKGTYHVSLFIDKEYMKTNLSC